MFCFFSEFYEPASRQSPAPQTVRQWEEVGSDLRPGAFINSYSYTTKPAFTMYTHLPSSYYSCRTTIVSSANTHNNARSVVYLQERFQVKNPPHTYIQKLRGYLDPGVTRKVGQCKWPVECSVHLKGNFYASKGVYRSWRVLLHMWKRFYKVFCGAQVW